jgi:hypothetical protein
LTNQNLRKMKVKNSFVQKFSGSSSKELLDQPDYTRVTRKPSADVHGSSSKEIGKLERKLEKQNKFIAEMAQVLSTYDSEVKARDERKKNSRNSSPARL